jgi:hypothetical protein
MSLRRAARIDATQPAIVKALRADGCYVWIIGIPVDLMAGKDGKTHLFEVKTLTGKRNPKPSERTKLQIDFMDNWNGSPVHIVCTPEEALEVIRGPA